MSEQVKEILLEQAKTVGIQAMRLAGGALLSAADKLEEKREKVPSGSLIEQA